MVYADGQVIIIKGNTIKEIEGKWERIFEECMEWANRKNMKYNASKTEGW